jgi:hypothetical protein
MLSLLFLQRCDGKKKMNLNSFAKMLKCDPKDVQIVNRVVNEGIPVV